MIKAKMYIATAILITLAALFFQFNRIDQQRMRLQQAENTVTGPTQQEPPLAGDITDSGKEAEWKKVIPSTIPIFMYHYIRDYSDPRDPIGENLSVSPRNFDEQIAWLKENGYQSVSLNFFDDPQPVSFKPILLTFDDGYQDAYDAALPVLKKYEMSGVFYLIVNKIGTPGYLTWGEIIQMQTAGMSFGSHTFSHSDLRNLSKINLEEELQESKEVLEEHLGKEITDFCYPSGKYNSETLKEVQAAGYKTAVTITSGVATLKSNPYLLQRLRITQNTKIQEWLLK